MFTSEKNNNNRNNNRDNIHRLKNVKQWKIIMERRTRGEERYKNKRMQNKRQQQQ